MVIRDRGKEGDAVVDDEADVMATGLGSDTLPTHAAVLEPTKPGVPEGQGMQVVAKPPGLYWPDGHRYMDTCRLQWGYSTSASQKQRGAQ